MMKRAHPNMLLPYMLLGCILLAALPATGARGAVAKSAAGTADRAWSAPGSEVAARTPSSRPLRIVAVYGPGTIRVGELANFRVRLADGAARPVIYRWHMGDGTAARGNNVAHRFTRPGRYEVTATARNASGSDSHTIVVEVRENAARNLFAVGAARRSDSSATAGAKAPARRSASIRTTYVSAAEAAFRGSHPIAWSEAGFTLLASNTPNRRDAEATATELRRRGLRAGLYLDDSGRGSPVFRIVVGQFADSDAAVLARKRLIAEGYEGAFLVHHLPDRASLGQ